MGSLAVVWGLVGIFGLLVSAVCRLGMRAADAWSYSFDWTHWVLFFTGAVFMLYSEGYKGFQKGFSPRVAARALYLRENPTILRTLLAPLFLMGYFHSTRKRKIVSYSLTIGIVLLILMVRFLSQPWRGIVDAFVVLGLLYGIISLVAFCFKALLSPQFDYSPEVFEEPSGLKGE